MDIATILSLLGSLPGMASTAIDMLSALHLLGVPVGAIGRAVGWVALFVWLFFGLYVCAMGLYRVQLRGQLSPMLKVFGWPYVALAVLVDVAAQYTLANVVFAGLPAQGEYLVTKRLQRLRRDDPTGWRGRLAAYICDSGLDPLDPSGDHC